MGVAVVTVHRAYVLKQSVLGYDSLRQYCMIVFCMKLYCMRIGYVFVRVHTCIICIITIMRTGKCMLICV